ncbi:MAG: hypothetical protein JSR46_00895 [Verrucomicrobia bacterium]|nr:hypothetical protein [Verrucomicrobiota bacterium]
MSNGPRSVSQGDMPVYDTSHIKNAPHELLGRNVRIETKGDKQIIHIDTTVGKFFRQALYDTRYSDLVEVRKILESITQPDAATDQKPISAKDLQVIQAVRDSITNKEKKLLKELLKDPAIKVISNIISKPEALPKDQLRLLKEHGVNLKHKTINLQICCDKLVEDIAPSPILNVLGKPITTDLRADIWRRLHEKGTELSMDPMDYPSVQENNKQKEALASLRSLHASESPELKTTFENADPKVQLKFMLGIPKEKKNRPIINELFQKMDGDSKYSFISKWLSNIDANSLSILKESCPNIKNYIDNEFPKITEAREQERQKFEMIRLIAEHSKSAARRRRNY